MAVAAVDSPLVPRFAFWINDIDAVIWTLEGAPDVGDELDFGIRGKYIVTLERPNHDPTVVAAYTAEPALET
jgi:hypothetical protein